MKRRFGTRLLVATLLLAVVPLVAVGWLVIDLNRRALRERSHELLIAVTDDVAHTADATLDEARAALAAVARVLADLDLPAAQRIAAARAIVESSVLDVVAIYGPGGEKIDVIREAGATWTAPEQLAATLRDAAAADGEALGDVELAGDLPIVPIAAPVRGELATWTVVAPVSLERLAARLATLSHERFGDDPEALVVVDRSLRTVAHADPERVAARARVTSGALAGVDGEALAHGLLVFRSHGDRLGLARSLPGLPWAVVAEVPAARVYAPLARVRTLVVVSVGVTALLGAAFAVWLARRTARPVATLVGAARDLGERRFDRPVALTTGDELETLAGAINRAAAELSAGERAVAEQAAIRRDLGRYLPAQLVDRIVRREHPLELGGERREVSVLFVDVAAFTPLAERLPPDQVVTLINELFTLLTEIVFRHGGTVDKFIGDCVMAMWNAPDAQPDHAARAVAAAIDMQRWLDAANDGWEARLGVTLHLAIGVHTGDAVVGNLGSEARMDYTCLGDAVNVAARLEALARPQQVLVSEATRRAAGDRFRWLPLGRQTLPGRLEPVELHEALV